VFGTDISVGGSGGTPPPSTLVISSSLTQIDASHWAVTAPGHAAEVFTLAATLNPAAGDVVFK
jgi:hypothetical protein